jgi:hypothetical protein
MIQIQARWYRWYSTDDTDTDEMIQVQMIQIQIDDDTDTGVEYIDDDRWYRGWCYRCAMQYRLIQMIQMIQIQMIRYRADNTN